MEKTGILRKMNVAQNDVVQYWMNLNESSVHLMNDLIGKPISLIWTGKINCISCGKSLKKTFGQGFCYTCFTEAPEAAPCIMRPELCEAHLGKGRDVDWEERNHNQPHIVYLAQTSSVKVGVTRSTQVPTRWIDQGAWRALPLATTPYRQLAGLIEVELKQFLSDRTDWRKMLKGENGAESLKEIREEVLSFLPDSLAEYSDFESECAEFTYPVNSYPEKISTLKLEDNNIENFELTGIRGQYLYLNGNQVINMRKYSGFEVTLKA